jgi:acetyl esterase/lipase
MTFEQYQAAMDAGLRTGFTRIFGQSRAGEHAADGLSARRQQVAKSAAYARQQLSVNDRVRATDRRVPGQQSGADVNVRVYEPTKTIPGKPAVLWIHGGAFVLGTADQDEALCQRFVERSGAVVVSVDYRLAPEYPFPAALDDCYAALRWMQANAEQLQIDISRIAVAGASSGGSLAAALALLARDRAEVGLAFQLLLYPCLDDRLISVSSREISAAGMIGNREEVLHGWRAYLIGASDDVPPYAAPARATNLERLPPAYLMVGELDVLRDETVAYAMRLMEAGVKTELHVYPGAFHGFDKMVPAAPISTRAVHEYQTALDNVMKPDGVRKRRAPRRSLAT